MTWPADFDLTTIEYRLWPKIQITPTCWWWSSQKCPHGYGRFAIAGKPQQAHRVVYTLIKGPIPDGLTLDHLCRNRGCVNPDHLEAVTGCLNTQRGIHTGLQSSCLRGHPLSEDNVIVRGNHRACRICLLALRKTDKYRAQTAAYDHRRYLAKKAQKLSAKQGDLKR